MGWHLVYMGSLHPLACMGATGVLNCCPSDRQMSVVQSLRMGGCGSSLLGWELQPSQRPVGVASRVSIPMQEPLGKMNSLDGRGRTASLQAPCTTPHCEQDASSSEYLLGKLLRGNLPRSLPVLENFLENCPLGSFSFSSSEPASCPKMPWSCLWAKTEGKGRC